MSSAVFQKPILQYLTTFPLWSDVHFDLLLNILREKSLAIIYNGVSHRRSLKH